MIGILYHVRCQAGEEKAIKVYEKDRVVIEGTIEAPADNIKGYGGPVIGYKVMATKITKIKE